MRKLEGWPNRLVSVLSITIALFTMYTAGFWRPETQVHRSIFLGFILPMAFLLYPARKRDRGGSTIPWYDWVLAAVAVLPFAWIVYSIKRLVYRLPYLSELHPFDIVLGAIAIVLVLEATRRVLGWLLVILASMSFVYAYFGPYFVGMFSHRGFTIRHLVEMQYLLMEGLSNFLVGVIATFVFMFIIFGAFLDKSGVGKFYLDMCLALAGRSPGGPAKVAVLSSAMMGTLSGSTIANVVTTGSLTIPLMKKIGYKPHEAGGIETAASTGGAIMPPVMGAAALIMAEMTGIPYGRIIIVSIVPALLYFATVMWFVDLKARRRGFGGLDRSELPSLWGAIRSRGHLFLPVVGLVYFLIKGYTPFYAGYVATLGVVVVSSLKRETRMSFRDMLEALDGAGRSVVSIAIISATAALLVGVIVMTGLVTKMASIILELSRGRMFPAILITILTSYVLGMALPVSTCYILQAVVAVPAMVRLGASVLGAHMLVLWYSQDATITPPVCMTAFAAAAIAGAEPMRTGLEALKIAKGLYFIPLLFVYSDLLNASFVHTIGIAIGALIALLAIASALEGYMLRVTTRLERLILVAGAVPLFIPGLYTDLVGFACLAAVFLMQKLRPGPGATKPAAA